jgi:carboxymethylenebutenolidase
MTKTLRLTAEDGHTLDAYIAEPENPNGNAVVILQEIFGVNRHIRDVADDYAREGFLAIAPALFDRVQPGMELGYRPEDIQNGLRMATTVGVENATTDVAAAIDHVAKEVGQKRVGVVGYCWGGTLAWLAATRLEPGAAVGYYGGQIAKYAAEQPECPVMLHFGKLDQHIPEDEIAKIRRNHPGVTIFMYDAGHGFNTEPRESFEPNSARAARDRTLAFLRKHLSSGS